MLPQVALGCRRAQPELRLFTMTQQGPHILQNIPKGSGKSKHAALPYEPVCAVFRKYLRGEKLKFTPERAMMLDAVLRKQGRFDPDQLAEDLKALGHNVSRATLYRTLTHLMDAGILRQVFFENRKVFYEVIAGRQPYDHLICMES